MQENTSSIFDAHLHIIDKRFPVIENQGYMPDEFTASDYRGKTAAFNIVGGAVVSGSFQGFDQTYLIDALSLLGPGFVGVTQITAETDDDTIRRLNDAGVRAVRFNLKRGGSEKVAKIATMARRIQELVNWHVELYVDSSDLPELFPTLVTLPAFSIDHLGLTKANFDVLLKLVERGAKVKATGFGRLDFDPAIAIKAIYSANPDALMFGTDLPSTRAPRPFQPSDMDIIRECLDDKGAHKVMCANGIKFYSKPTAG